MYTGAHREDHWFKWPVKFLFLEIVRKISKFFINNLDQCFFISNVLIFFQHYIDLTPLTVLVTYT